MVKVERARGEVSSVPRTNTFQSITYPVVGGSYQDPSKPLSQQRTLNMYLELTKAGRADAVLKSWPGLKLWSAGVAGEYDRLIYKKLFLGKAYKVSGSKLYSFDSTGTQTEIGVISGGGQVTIEDNGSVMVIVAGNTAYQYDGTTLSTISLSFTPKSVSYLNNQFIYAGTDGRQYISTAGLTTVIAGNSFSPDSSSDNLVRGYVFDQFLLNFNERTIEPWENTGTGIPPFERMDGVIAEQTGIAGQDAINNTGQAVYFLGEDSEPYQMVNFQVKKIGDPAVSSAIQGYGDNSACRVFVASFKSQDFIQFHFPLVGKTWMYCQQTQIWSELDHDVNGQRYIGNSIARLFDKILVGDNSNGNIYELDPSTFQNNGMPIARERIARPLSGEQLAAPRQRLKFSALYFSLSTGVGNPSDVNPQVETELTTDGVKFGSTVWHELGRDGEFQQNIYHSTNVSCTDLACKIRCTDNCDFAIYSASVDYKVGGR